MLFIIGFEIRAESALLIFAIGTPFLLYPYSFFNKAYYSKKLHLLAFLLLCLGLHFLDELPYNNEEWSQYTSYNHARGWLSDNPLDSMAINILDNDVQKKEYSLLCEYRVNDGTILSAGDLERCATFLKYHWKDCFLQNGNDYLRSTILLGILVPAFYLFLLSLYLFFSKRVKLLFTCWSSFFLFIMSLLYMMTMCKPKERVLIPSIILLIFIYLYTFYANRIEVNKYVIILPLVLFSFLYSKKTLDFSSYTYSYLRDFEEVECIMNKVPFDKILVHNGVPINTNVFNCSQSALGQKLVRAGWLINSPHTKKYYKGFLSYLDGLPMIVNNDNFDRINTIQELLDKHYKIKTERECIEESEHYSVILLKKKE